MHYKSLPQRKKKGQLLPKTGQKGHGRAIHNHLLALLLTKFELSELIHLTPANIV